jgi:hypothetical protein
MYKNFISKVNNFIIFKKLEEGVRISLPCPRCKKQIRFCSVLNINTTYNKIKTEIRKGICGEGIINCSCTWKIRKYKKDRTKPTSGSMTIILVHLAVGCSISSVEYTALTAKYYCIQTQSFG